MESSRPLYPGRAASPARMPSGRGWHDRGARPFAGSALAGRGAAPHHSEEAMTERRAVADTATSGPLSPSELRLMDAYWRAANYLSVGQIYLFDNPLLA